MISMSATRPESERICIFQHYTRAWEMGTGLRVSLAPGEYRITGEENLDGVRYFRLDETYRVDVSNIVD